MNLNIWGDFQICISVPLSNTVFYFSLLFYFEISELRNSEILVSLNAPPTPYRPSKIIFWTKLGSKDKKINLRGLKSAFLKYGF